MGINQGGLIDEGSVTFQKDGMGSIIGGVTYSRTSAVRAVDEAVTVPAGSFQAIRNEVQLQTNGLLEPGRTFDILETLMDWIR